MAIHIGIFETGTESQNSLYLTTTFKHFITYFKFCIYLL